MTKKTRNIAFGAVGIVILLILLSPRFKLFDSRSGGAVSPSGPGAPLPVNVYVVAPGKLENRIRSTGTILANEEVVMQSERSGKVTRIYFKEGSQVRKGQLLTKINDTELQASLLKLRSQEKLAEDKEQRRRTLFEKNNISPEDYEVTLNELNSIRAERQLIEAQIAKTEIRAPFDGKIGLRYVSEGSYVSSDTRIASLQDVNTVKVDFAIPEKYVNQVRPGQRIKFTIAGTNDNHSGTIYAVEPKIDLETRTVQLRAYSANKGGRIVPGSFAEIELVLQAVVDALMVPSESLVPELQGQKVFLVRGGSAVPQAVETGIRTERMVQITQGISKNDTVITSGTMQLRPGAPVRITSIELK